MLYNNRYAPSTFEIGFIDGSTTEVVREFIEWQTGICQPFGVSLAGREYTGALSSLLDRLAPLTRVESRRYLFVPTDSRWTAYFDSGHQGTDATSAISAMCQLYKHEGFRVVNSPHVKPAGSRITKHGAVMLEKYGPVGLPINNTERAISSAHNGSRWEFDASGDPFPFENLESYNKAKKARDRFTPDMLNEYLMHFGIKPFDPDFYQAVAEHPAVLVEKSGPHFEGYAEYSFAELAIKYKG